MEKKRVLIWYWGRKGGGARYTLELLKELLNFDDLEIHTSFSKNSELYDEISELNLPNFDIPTYTNLSEFLKNSFRLKQLRKDFKNYLKENQIEVVFCSMNHLWNFYFISLFKPAGIKFILAMHDAIAHVGENFGFRNFLLKKEVSKADHFVALSEHVQKQIIQAYGVAENKISIIPHGMFNYPEDAEFPGRKDEFFNILYFGRILPYKGPKIMVDAFRILKKKYPYCRLIIAGNGNIKLLGDIRGLNNIELNLRWIAEKEVKRFFLRSDVVVTPYIEASQSGVIPTAYAEGKPVVTTPVGGLQEQVKHEETGLVAEEISAEAVASCLERLLNDTELREKCAKNARRFADEQLSWEKIAEKTHDLLVNYGCIAIG